MKKRILVLAYAAMNLGDDLFVKLLCNRYKNHSFILICPRIMAKPFLEIKNLKIVLPVRFIDTFLSKLRIGFSVNSKIKLFYARKCDATVNIGGSIFMQQNKDWQEKFYEYRRLLDKCRKFFVISSNFGPYYDKSFYLSYLELFKKANDVCFRDYYSYFKFRQIKTARYAPDVLFGQETNTNYEYSGKKYVVISVIDLSKRGGLSRFTEEYEKKIVEISDMLVAEGFKVILMSFCGSEGDVVAIDRILKKTKSSEVSYYLYNGNTSEALNTISSADYIIATRFHSLVLGWVFGKPVFPFIYSEKIEHVLDDVGYSGYRCYIEDVKTLDINKVRIQILNKPKLDVNEQIINADSQFKYLDVFMNSEFDSQPGSV